jgi:chorismate synthase
LIHTILSCPLTRNDYIKGRVAAGAIAEKYLRLSHSIEIVAFVSSVGNEHLFPPTLDYPTFSTNPEFLKLVETIDRETVDGFVPVRCPNKEASALMTKAIETFRDKKDSIGGTVTCVIRNVPVGLGEPCFDKLEAKLAHAMLSIPATKGFEIGSGFGGCELPGSIHNDRFVAVSDSTPNKTNFGIGNGKRLTTQTNNSGGIQGGISNGTTIYFRVAFKPPATIGVAQTTANYWFEEGILEAKGRHDPCVVPRAIPIVEAMSALVIIDALMAQNAREMAKLLLPPLPKNLPTRPLRISAFADMENPEFNPVTNDTTP